MVAIREEHYTFRQIIFLMNDEKKIIDLEDVQENNYIKLSIGKKNHLKVKVN